MIDYKVQSDDHVIEYWLHYIETKPLRNYFASWARNKARDHDREYERDNGWY